MKPTTRHAHKPWTPANDRELRRLAAIEGQTHVTIGLTIRRSAAAVSNRCYSLGIRLASSKRREDPLDGIYFNGEPLKFSETGESCARCGVREDRHREFGCGQFAEQLKVRER
jgi:hypothetical protein